MSRSKKTATERRGLFYEQHAAGASTSASIEADDYLVLPDSPAATIARLKIEDEATSNRKDKTTQTSPIPECTCPCTCGARSAVEKKQEVGATGSSDNDKDIEIPARIDNKQRRKPLYRDEEIMQMFAFLIDTKSIHRAKGRKVFDEMSLVIKQRTGSSLYNKFNTQILPNVEKWLSKLHVEPKIRREFIKLRNPFEDNE